jgi:hypothetical protein
VSFQKASGGFLSYGFGAHIVKVVHYCPANGQDCGCNSLMAFGLRLVLGGVDLNLP